MPDRIRECLIVGETVETAPDAVRDALVCAGFTPESAAAAAQVQDWSLLVHSGRVRRVHLTGRKTQGVTGA